MQAGEESYFHDGFMTYPPTYSPASRKHAQGYARPWGFLLSKNNSALSGGFVILSHAQVTIADARGGTTVQSFHEPILGRLTVLCRLLLRFLWSCESMSSRMSSNPG
jgi:hypothetical protein